MVLLSVTQTENNINILCCQMHIWFHFPYEDLILYSLNQDYLKVGVVDQSLLQHPLMQEMHPSYILSLGMHSHAQQQSVNKINQPLQSGRSLYQVKYRLLKVEMWELPWEMGDSLKNVVFLIKFKCQLFYCQQWFTPGIKYVCYSPNIDAIGQIT